MDERTKENIRLHVEVSPELYAKLEVDAITRDDLRKSWTIQEKRNHVKRMIVRILNAYYFGKTN